MKACVRGRHITRLRACSCGFFVRASIFLWSFFTSEPFSCDLLYARACSCVFLYPRACSCDFFYDRVSLLLCVFLRACFRDFFPSWPTRALPVYIVGATTVDWIIVLLWSMILIPDTSVLFFLCCLFIYGVVACRVPENKIQQNGRRACVCRVYCNQVLRGRQDWLHRWDIGLHTCF